MNFIKNTALVFICMLSTSTQAAEQRKIIVQVENLSLVNFAALTKIETNRKPRSFQQVCQKHTTKNPLVQMELGDHKPMKQKFSLQKNDFEYTTVFNIHPEKTMLLDEKIATIYKELQTKNYKNAQEKLDEYVVFCDKHSIWDMPNSLIDSQPEHTFYYPQDFIKKLAEHPNKAQLLMPNREWKYLSNNATLNYLKIMKIKIETTNALICPHYEYDKSLGILIERHEKEKYLKNKCLKNIQNLKRSCRVNSLFHKQFSSSQTVEQWFKELVQSCHPDVQKTAIEMEKNDACTYIFI